LRIASTSIQQQLSRGSPAKTAKILTDMQILPTTPTRNNNKLLFYMDIFIWQAFC